MAVAVWKPYCETGSVCQRASFCFHKLSLQVDRTVKEFDSDGDGQLNLEEFKAMLRSRPWSALVPPQEVCSTL